MVVVYFLTALLVCQVRAQICGPGPLFSGPYGPGSDPFPIQPIGSPPCGPPFINLPNQIPPCSIINQPQPFVGEIPVAPAVIANPCPPVVTTTILDNSLANSLANAIQLLIVSNLIENTLGSSNGASVAECLGIIPDTPYVNNFELVTDYYSNPIVPVPCDCPAYDPFPTYEVPCYQEPIFQPCIEPCGVPYPQYATLPVINELPFAFDNCAPNVIGLDTCNQIGVPYGCADMVISPVAVEVPFPASIPAQLLCNFGYMPNNMPCVSVNVEPLPIPYLDSCNNPFGNICF